MLKNESNCNSREEESRKNNVDGGIDKKIFEAVDLYLRHQQRVHAKIQSKKQLYGTNKHR